MTETEHRIKAKIPGPETGIEVKQTICDICAPGKHCGIDAYIKHGKVIKIEGSRLHPVNRGLLCTKGLSNRQYIYRKDRIKTPLKRISNRGEFEPITWEQAYTEISEKLNGIKDTYGADSVVFFTGYNKWYRPFLKRFAYAFGSINYGGESSTCATASMMAWRLATGVGRVSPDFMNAGVFLGWAYNPYYSSYLMPAKVEEARAKGLKIIIVDPRETPATEKQCDLHLQIKPGTDGALALGIAKILIENDWIDRDFINDRVYGFKEYSEYVKQFDINLVSKITAIPKEKIMAAVIMIVQNLPVAIHETAAAVTHHLNGLQNYRAIMALSAITGSFDRIGGQLPRMQRYFPAIEQYEKQESEFANELRPINHKPIIGSERFPLWTHLIGDMQAVDLSRQIIEEKPYPVKAIFALGMNFRMVNDSAKMHQAIDKVDFFVNTDLFLTDTSRCADIILPACSSFERSEFKVYNAGYATMTQPVIKPLYDSKPDTEILFELAKFMDLKDSLLKSDYETCIRHITRDINFDLVEMKNNPYPVKIKDIGTYTPGSFSFRTPTGKFELRSTVIEECSETGLDPLPTYTDHLDGSDRKQYPFILSTGARLPNTLHSRLHDVAWTRSIRPDPTADISREDATEMQISRGDDIEIYTEKGSIVVKANPTLRVKRGEIYMYHGYREADVNQLIDFYHNDPYSGFPGYNTVLCGVRKRYDISNKKQTVE